MKNGKYNSNMNNIKVIKNNKDYLSSIKMLEDLLDKETDEDSADIDKIELLSQLIEDYEEANFEQELPTPVEAIIFRMDQLNLKQTDLIEFIGSKSKVSEVLSGKTPLSIKMIRSLEKNLKIPAKVLIQEPIKSDTDFFNGWDPKIIKELKKRGYIEEEKVEENQIYKSLKSVFVDREVKLNTLFRQSNYRIRPSTSRQALAGWLACVIKKANKIENSNKFIPQNINLEFMQRIAKTSTLENAPLLVKKILEENGINLIIEPSFPSTKLDGAVVLNKNNPIIALTLRFDRLDNFWFTLLHEIAHISLHHSDEEIVFYDELEDVKGVDLDIKEIEADKLAAEALIPSAKWNVSPAKIIPSKMSALSLAEELGIHPAIVAGKIRHESGNYSKLTDMITDSKVRFYFE